MLAPLILSSVVPDLSFLMEGDALRLDTPASRAVISGMGRGRRILLLVDCFSSCRGAGIVTVDVAVNVVVSGVVSALS